MKMEAEPMLSTTTSNPFLTTQDMVPETPNKTRKRTRLRRLADGNAAKKFKHDAASSNVKQRFKRLMVRTLLVAAAFAVIMGHLMRQDDAKAKLMRDFLSKYRKQYNQIVHGQQDYCDKRLDTQALFTRISQQSILHQSEALLQLELALRNDSRITAIALVGAPGVGKSLFARAVEEYFPWSENVQSYAWNTFVPMEVDKFSVLVSMIHRLSDCGRNLLVIENLGYKDRHVVRDFNRKLMVAAKADEDAEIRPKHVIVMYIFSMNTMLPPSEYMQQHAELQTLPDTRTINFRRINKEQLTDCIWREARLENLTISTNAFEHISESIDAEGSGCKHVHAKLMMYAKL